MDPAKYAEIFLEESREHLTAVNQQLLQWEREPEATEPVAEIFRAVHNIKGMAATMGYNGVATLAHRVENLLDLLRRQERAVTPETLGKAGAKDFVVKPFQPSRVLEAVQRVIG